MLLINQVEMTHVAQIIKLNSLSQPSQIELMLNALLNIIEWQKSNSIAKNSFGLEYPMASIPCSLIDN